jgi:hypothetical protein
MVNVWFPFLLWIFAIGSKINTPRLKRIALKVNGPIEAMPTRCATKAKPQMAAVINNKRSAFNPVWLSLSNYF